MPVNKPSRTVTTQETARAWRVQWDLEESNPSYKFEVFYEDIVRDTAGVELYRTRTRVERFTLEQLAARKPQLVRDLQNFIDEVNSESIAKNSPKP